MRIKENLSIFVCFFYFLRNQKKENYMFRLKKNHVKRLIDEVSLLFLQLIIFFSTLEAYCTNAWSIKCRYNTLDVS